MNDQFPQCLNEYIPLVVQARQSELTQALGEATDINGVATVDSILHIAQKTAPNITRGDVVQFLQIMEDTGQGAGRFVVGRRGQKSRFEWFPRVIADLKLWRSKLLGSPADPELAIGNQGTLAQNRNPPLGASPDHEKLYHRFNLRPDFQIELVLPTDFTSREAERLAGFVKSLPLE